MAPDLAAGKSRRSRFFNTRCNTALIALPDRRFADLTRQSIAFITKRMGPRIERIDDASGNLGAWGADMSTDLLPRIILIALVAFLASPAHPQPAPPGQLLPNAVSIERSVVFDVTAPTGSLKETVQKGQQLLWRARRSPNDRRFELTDMSVAFLRSEAPNEVKITFAAHVSAFGWRPESDPKLEVIVRTRGGASIYAWNFAVSVRCADSNRPLSPLSQVVPSDIAANLFSSVGTVEISEYREPNAVILTARQCPT
jgi:hypothetical protein